MKAFIACILAALEFAQVDALERPVHLAFSYDEEIGCLGAPRLIERIQSSIALPAVVIVGEPSEMRIMGSHKSVDIYKVHVTGVAAHSSATHLGVSANALAIRLMHILLRIAGRLAADDMHNRDFEPPFSTLTIGIMQGGAAANILAAEASFVFDLRCIPEHNPDEALKPFHAELASIRREYPTSRITFELRASVPSLAKFLNGHAEGFVRLISGDTSESTTASFGAEAGLFQQAGFSTVICGPGSMVQGHQPDEFIEIRQVEKCMCFMGKLFEAMCQPLATA